jgi:hypothetical protein
VSAQYDGAVTVTDLRSRARRTTCRAEQVGDYVVVEDGAVACLVEVGDFPYTQEIRSEGALLDSGTGMSRLRRRGGEIVWLHDGAERTAPLPRRG